MNEFLNWFNGIPITNQVALIVAGITLFGVVLTILSNVLLGHSNIKANVVSKARIEWIQNARDFLSDYISVALEINYIHRQGDSEGFNDKYNQSVTRLNTLRSLLKLNLGPDNKGFSDYSNLNFIEKIDSLYKFIQNEQKIKLKLKPETYDAAEIDFLIDDLVSFGRSYFKIEWLRSCRQNWKAKRIMKSSKKNFVDNGKSVIDEKSKDEYDLSYSEYQTLEAEIENEIKRHEQFSDEEYKLFLKTIKYNIKNVRKFNLAKIEELQQDNEMILTIIGVLISLVALMVSSIVPEEMKLWYVFLVIVTLGVIGYKAHKNDVLYNRTKNNQIIREIIIENGKLDLKIELIDKIIINF